MKTNLFKIFGLTIFLLLFSSCLWSQGKVYEGPDDPAGDIAAEREGYMNQNRVYLYFQNTTELAKWVLDVVGSGWSRWPNTQDGVRMLDGIGLLIGARVYIENDSIPVTELNEIRSRSDLDTLYFLQTSYREEMDTDPTGTVEWGLYPVFGYLNENSEYPAMSNRPNSWPVAGWPDANYQLKWPGEWDGRFGRGQTKADLETYFVTNDAQDQEYLGPEDRVRYFPRPGVYIGDLKPDVTIQYGKPWGGLGVRVEQRGFQWSNAQAQDCIFWEYTIANISDYDLPEVAFGYWVDNGIGGEQDDEIGYFDRQIDMAYSWDNDGIGEGGLRTGIMGFAYLESPGISWDGLDNDGDGLVDEQRDNNAVALIGPTDGIHDLDAFLNFYLLDEEDLREHWDADEDQDWDDGFDANGDGVYQVSENPGDDVGIDGVGPVEINYDGPDEGECNHRPDRKEGDSEPDFAETDVSESDMIGLTAFMLFPVPSHASEYRWFRGDQSMWELMGSDSLIEYLGDITNLVEVFASGPFPLYQGRTERISMSELHAYDPLSGLNSASHSAPALYEQKRIVQVIYESDYRYPKPPLRPTLYATPGDGCVVLSWDNKADTQTREPFLKNVNDFEGYKLYRATDKQMSDAQIVTDGFGNPAFGYPIFQCDLIDEIKSFAEFGLVNGAAFYLGDDTGIQHYYVDDDPAVQNGRTYYYVLTAYDYGLENIGPGIRPAENRYTIDVNEAEEVVDVSSNVQIVTPRQSAAGYEPPDIDVDLSGIIFGSGIIEPEILANSDLKTDHTYRVEFHVDTIDAVDYYDYGLLYVNNGLAIFDVTEGDSLVYEETPESYAFENIMYDDSLGVSYLLSGRELYTDIFDGLRLRFNLPVVTAEVDVMNTGWLVGGGEIRLMPTEKEMYYFPWDYDIIFTDDSSAYTGRVTAKTMRDEENRRIGRNDLLVGESFHFYVVNRSIIDSTGSYELMDLAVQDMNRNGVYDLNEDRILVGAVNNLERWAGTVFIMDFIGFEFLPPPESVLRISFLRPFFSGDYLTFTVNPEVGIVESQLKKTLKNVKVVPNPYVATNYMEPSLSNPRLNQRRRLMFTHVPAQCTIKIFTMSGIFIDEIVVENSSDDGTAFWDLLTKEGLEVAAGMYIYHIKSTATGDEKMGKFAIVK